MSGAGDGPEQRQAEAELLDDLEAEVIARHEALADEDDDLPPPCSYPRGHDWCERRDWQGDGNVFRGTISWRFWVCRHCGMEETIEPREIR
jgi:hypothetical protein